MTSTRTQPATRTLDAVDLAAPGGHGVPWRSLRTAARPLREPFPGLPPDLLITPAGYGFFESVGPPGPGVRRVVVVPPGRPGAEEWTGGDAAPGSSTDHRRFPAVVLSPRAARTLSPALARGLTLEVGPGRAHVGIDATAWPGLSPPILLTIGLCWRSDEIARRLDDLTGLARDACIHPGWSRPVAGRRQRRLGPLLRELRSLVLDLPCFEGPLIDPRGYFPTPGHARLFGVLARRLGLQSWRELNGERVEIVEATLEALAEEKRHRLAVGCEIALEVLIILALVADLGINLVATLAVKL